MDLPAGELFVALQVLLAMRTGKLEVTHKKLGSVAQACLSGSRGAKDKMQRPGTACGPVVPSRWASAAPRFWEILSRYSRCVSLPDALLRPFRALPLRQRAKFPRKPS